MTPNPTAANRRAVPLMSTDTSVVSSLGRDMCPRTTPRIPMGMLMRKIQCQDSMPTRNPPRAGPRAKPRAAATDMIPRDLPRCSGGSSFTQIIGATAARAAAPTPWTILETISRDSDGDRAHARDPAVNTTNPRRNTLRMWPASAILPNGSSSPASIRK